VTAWVLIALGAAKEERKGCHPPAVTADTPYFDVPSVMNSVDLDAFWRIGISA